MRSRTWGRPSRCRRCASGGLDDAVHDGVAEVHVVGGHVNLGSQHHGAFVELSAVHALEQVDVFLHGAVAEGGGRAGFGGRALLGGYLLAGLLVDVCLAFAYQALCQLEQLREIVGGVVEAVAPVIAQPVDVFLDGLHVFGILLLGVGVVETEVARAAELFGRSEVHDESLGVSDVEVAVGLGRKTGVEASAVLAGGQVVYYFLLHEAEACLVRGAVLKCLCVDFVVHVFMICKHSACSMVSFKNTKLVKIAKIWSMR